jgi:hypothetical protein
MNVYVQYKQEFGLVFIIKACQQGKFYMNIYKLYNVRITLKLIWQLFTYFNHSVLD